jgi:hypothetical protein
LVGVIGVPPGVVGQRECSFERRGALTARACRREDVLGLFAASDDRGIGAAVPRW